MKVAKVAVVGCGPSGLCAIKNCISEGFEVLAFEQTSEIGGEWNSNLEIGPNVHSKIYEGLETNFTKELMEYSDFSYSEEETESFLTQDKVFKYFKSYTKKFELKKYIKFNRRVIRVRPVDNQWEIIVQNLKNDEFETIFSDTIFICNGLSSPWMPKFEGQNIFKGNILHSRDYRNTKIFKGEKVLLIGSGTSAFDMVIAIDKVAEKIVWLNKIQQTHGKQVNLNLSSNSIIKTSQVKRFTKSGAEFEDGSFEEFDTIAFATGYDFTFPFLSVDSGISVYDKCVQPLYKQCINANRPSMAIIGLPWFTLRIPLFELQIKFCMQYWSGRKNLPSREEMLQDIQEDFKNRNITENLHKAHYLGFAKHGLYFDDLAKTSGIEPLKQVLVDLSTHQVQHAFENYKTFRFYNYKVLNDFEFSCNCKLNLIKNEDDKV